MLPQNVQLLNQTLVLSWEYLTLSGPDFWRGLICPVVPLPALLENFLNDQLLFKYFP